MFVISNDSLKTFNVIVDRKNIYAQSYVLGQNTTRKVYDSLLCKKRARLNKIAKLNHKKFPFKEVIKNIEQCDVLKFKDEKLLKILKIYF